MFKTIPDRGGPQAVDGLDLEGHFDFCSPVELNLITNVLFIHIVLKLWFSPKTIDCKNDTMQQSC